MRFSVSQNRKTMAEDRIMITDGLLAAFLDGNVSSREAEAVLQAAATDSSLREFLSIASDVSDRLSQEWSPLAAVAADAPDRLCAVHCEHFVLKCFGVDVNETELISFAGSQSLINESGTPLSNVGCISEHYGLSVERIFAPGLETVIEALASGRQVIAAVDVGELDPDMAEYESLEDRIVGPRPDHCVVVLSCDLDDDEVVCYDPSAGDMPVSLSVGTFLDAWKDSDNYMISTGR